MAANIYEFNVTDIDHTPHTLAEFKDQVLLIVNTASQCGLTPQYEGLEELHKRFKSQGFSVLGFPCDQFLHQEPAEEPDIKEFCNTKYNISFPLFSKVSVNGEKTNPLYAYLKQQAPGILNSQKIKWNFTKFLVNRQGEVVRRYAPVIKPSRIVNDIQKLLT